jgi:hypothetical protein
MPLREGASPQGRQPETEYFDATTIWESGMSLSAVSSCFHILQDIEYNASSTVVSAHCPICSPQIPGLLQQMQIFIRTMLKGRQKAKSQAVPGFS